MPTFRTPKNPEPGAQPDSAGGLARPRLALTQSGVLVAASGGMWLLVGLLFEL